MEWPAYNSKRGKPVTTPTNQSILIAAASAAEAILPREVAAFRKRIDGCKNWRSDYIKIFEDFVKIQTQVPPPVVEKMCHEGLNKAASLFVFRDDTNTTSSLKEAFERSVNPLKTLTYKGTQAFTERVQFQLASPCGSDEEPLWVMGQNAASQIDKWEKYGCMEPSAALHAKALCLDTDVSGSVAHKTFCLLGVTSEMGPTYSLLKIPKAHVMGVSRAGSKVDKMVEWFEKEGSPDTILQFPEGGADLLKQAPQIAKWIIDTAPKNRELVLYPLAYMDGEANVRVTMAMDSIITYVMDRRDDVSLAFLCSPSIVYTIPPAAALDAKIRYESKSMFSISALLSMATLGYWLKPANTWKQIDKESTFPIVFNGLAHLQGPNYALAKTMQQWRCMAEHLAGKKVVAPYAPGTRTHSVTHSAEAAAALDGMQKFPPLLTFDVKPCSTLLAAIVLDQLNQGKHIKLEHPLELFWDGSVHGGSWRCPYHVESVMVLAYLLGKTTARGWNPVEAQVAPEQAEP